MITHEAMPLLEHALAPFARFWADPLVEDVLVNRPGEVFVRRAGTFTRHEIAADAIDLEGIAILTASLKRQNVGRSHPLLSADFPLGGIHHRLQACLPPAVEGGGAVLAIRRPKGRAPTLDELVQGGIFGETAPRAQGLSAADAQLVGLYRQAQQAPAYERGEAYMHFLRACMRAGKTHVLCGQVGSGKTHFSMGLANEISLDDRIVTIQDADEWKALPHQNRVDLFYSKGDQGEAQLSADHLVEASLRLSMRWLLLQEIRGKEAFSFMRARRSGHPGLTTCHAESASEVIPALALMAKQHPDMASVDLSEIERMMRGLVDVVVHFVRVGERFTASEVWFRLAEDQDQ